MVNVKTIIENGTDGARGDKVKHQVLEAFSIDTEQNISQSKCAHEYALRSKTAAS